MANRMAKLISHERYAELVRMPRKEAEKEMIAEKPEILSGRAIYMAKAVEENGTFYIDYVYS